MSKLTQGINIEDELNLYLIDNSLKPASLITLNPLNFDEGYNIRREGDIWFIHEETDIKLKPEHIEKFREFLDKLDVAYHQNRTENWQTCNENGKPIQAEIILFQVGRDESSLERLLNAKNDKNIGLALGFPVEAVEAYGKIIDDEMRNGQYVQISLAKAKQARLELPTWLAYISYIPEDLDLVGGKVSETSQELGEKYQGFVRANNPDLAKRVEQHFLNKRLPDYWERTPDRSYTIYFSPAHSN